jgi:phage terminase small subunit
MQDACALETRVAERRAPRISADSALSPQQRRFVEEFAAGGFTNQTKASEAAYRARGAAAISGASRLLAR